MRLLMLIFTGIVAAMALVKRGGIGRRTKREVAKRTHQEGFVQHSHGAMVHDHAHTHVVHNRREGADEFIGEWQHLTAEHAHGHNHAELVHSHAPHGNVEREHLGEAHIHDHEHPEKS